MYRYLGFAFQYCLPYTSEPSVIFIIYQSIYPSTHLSVYLPMYLPTYPNTYLFHIVMLWNYVHCWPKAQTWILWPEQTAFPDLLFQFTISPSMKIVSLNRLGFFLSFYVHLFCIMEALLLSYYWCLFSGNLRELR